MSIRIDAAVKRIITKDGAHSPLGPSSAKRWLSCPGSVRATRGMPSSSSVYADEGTAAHAVTEYCRIHDLPAKHFLGWKVEVHRDGQMREFPCDQEMVDSCQEFIDRCNEVPATYVLIEETLPFEEYVPGGFGTLDDGRLAPGIATITDFKHGKGVQVYAEWNDQLLCQALSVFLAWDWLYEFKKFVLRISQPRLGHFDSWEVDVEQLLNWAAMVLDPGAAYALSDEGAKKFAAGSWCQFCKLKASCETRTLWALSQVVQTPPDEFEDLDAAVAAAAEASGDIDRADQLGAEAMSGEALAKCLSVIDLVASWCKDVKAYAMRLLQQGQAVGDWKLVEGRSRRSWALPEEEIAEVLKEEGGIDPYEHKLLTPPKAEKLIGKKHAVMTAKDEDGNLIYVSKPPGKPKLAPGHDKRPAMSIDLLQEFGDLGAEEEKDDED